MSFSLTVVDRGFTDAVNKAAKLSPSDFRPEMAVAGKQLLDFIGAEFTNERDPYGTPWRPLAPLTVALKEAKGAPQPMRRLFEFGALSESFQVEVAENAISLFTNHRFDDGTTPEKHQFGGRSSLGGTIPPRPMMPMDGRPLPATWLNAIGNNLAKGLDRIFL